MTRDTRTSPSKRSSVLVGAVVVALLGLIGLARAADIGGGDISIAAPLAGANTGDVTLAAVGSTPNANGASLSGQALNLQPADGTNPGVCTAGTQTFGGAKTFTAAVTALSATTTALAGAAGVDIGAAAATSGATTKNSAYLYVRGNYWNGSASTAHDWRMYNSVTSTGPASVFVIDSPTVSNVWQLSNAGDLTLAGAASLQGGRIQSGTLHQKLIVRGNGNGTDKVVRFDPGGALSGTGIAYEWGNAPDSGNIEELSADGILTAYGGVKAGSSSSSITFHNCSTATAFDAASATLNCNCSSNITVTGAALGDAPSIGISADVSGTNGTYSAVVTGAATMKACFCSAGTAIDPGSVNVTLCATRG